MTSTDSRRTESDTPPESCGVQGCPGYLLGHPKPCGLGNRILPLGRVSSGECVAPKSAERESVQRRPPARNREVGGSPLGTRPFAAPPISMGYPHDATESEAAARIVKGLA